MKLDDFIKQQVEQHEEVYDPKAWESLSSRLDASAVAGTASSAVKWWIAAAVAVVAIAGGVIYFNSDDAGQQPVVVFCAIRFSHLVLMREFLIDVQQQKSMAFHPLLQSGRAISRLSPHSWLIH